MREILFRGKRLDNGEWVESGSLLRTKNEETGEFSIFLGSAKLAVYIFDSEKNVFSVTSLDECAYYRVDPDTVGQFTGLCDKNGKKIFEGDVVDASDTWWDASGPAGHDSPIIPVEWDEDICGFNPFADYDCDCGVYIYACRCEVIGNIHDNPELLEGEG